MTAASRQSGAEGTGGPAGLKVMPIDSVTLSDAHDPGERALTRRYVLHPDRSHGRLRRARSGGSVCVRTPGDAELSASSSGLLICRGEQSLCRLC
jgi:hypothetical protein